jgi:hypothetical protein
MRSVVSKGTGAILDINFNMLVSTYIVKFMPSLVTFKPGAGLTDMECGQHGLVELERLRASRRKKQNFLDDLSNSGLAVRLHSEGRATARPKLRVYVILS